MRNRGVLRHSLLAAVNRYCGGFALAKILRGHATGGVLSTARKYPKRTGPAGPDPLGTRHFVSIAERSLSGLTRLRLAAGCRSRRPSMPAFFG